MGQSYFGEDFLLTKYRSRSIPFRKKNNALHGIHALSWPS